MAKTLHSCPFGCGAEEGMMFSVVRAVCTIVFALFSGLWLYVFQADAFALMLQMLGLELTDSYALAGTILTTLLLLVLQFFVWLMIPLRGYFYALTYVPSMLLLVVLSRLPLHVIERTSCLSFLLVPLLFIALYLLVAFFIRGRQTVYQDRRRGVRPLESSPSLLRHTWANVLLLVVLFAVGILFSETNAVLVHRMRIERQMLQGQFDKALLIGKKSLESDASLTMLRIYALARQGALGEHLFHYPIVGSSATMLPAKHQSADDSSRLLCYPADSISHFIENHPAVKADYQLCGLLIDRQLDAFASMIGKYYPVSDSLPRHYREALTIYRHKRAQPVVEYHDPVLEEDYRNYQELKHRYSLPTAQRGKLREIYGQSYWYYYEFN